MSAISVDYESKFYSEGGKTLKSAKQSNRSDNAISANTLKEYESDQEEEYLPVGPEKEYKIKDIPMLIVFGIILIIYFYVGGYSLREGDPTKYVDGYDSWGNVCGRKNNIPIPNVNLSGKDLSEHMHAFHMGLIDFENAFNPIKYLYMERKPAVICVKECPKNITNCEKLLEDSGYKNIPQKYIEDNICVSKPGIILAHKSVFSRCIPAQIVRVVNKIKDNIEEKFDSIPTNETSKRADKQLAIYAKKVLTSISDYWPSILALMTASIGLCFITSVGLLLIARFLVILACLGVAMGLAFTGYLWYLYFEVQKTTGETETKDRSVSERKPAEGPVLSYINATARFRNAAVSSKDFFFDPSAVDVYTYDTNDQLQNDGFEEPPNPVFNLIAAIFASVFCLVLIILLIYFRKHMKIIIQLFDEACYAIFCIPCVLVQPLATIIFLVPSVFYFFAILAYILTIEKPVVDDRMFVDYQRDNSTLYFELFAGHLVGSYIVWQFAFACEKMIVAGAVANWYYRRERIGDCCPNSRIGICPTLGPTIYVIKYNLGTAAAGSLLITLTAVIRFFIDYAQKKAKDENFGLNCLCSCITCCCGCINEVIKFISHNAYIVAGMSGASFIAGGKRAVTLLIVSAATAWLFNIVSSFLLFLAKFFVAILSGVIAYFYYVNTVGKTAGLSDYWFPVFLITVVSYVVARCFFSAFGDVLDTIFICYCDDLDRNDGKAYFSTDGLKKSMNDAKSVNSNDSRIIDDYRNGDTPHPSGSTRGCFKRRGYVKMMALGRQCSLQDIPHQCNIAMHNSESYWMNDNVIRTVLSTSEYSRKNSLPIHEVVLDVDTREHI